MCKEIRVSYLQVLLASSRRVDSFPVVPWEALHLIRRRDESGPTKARRGRAAAEARKLLRDDGEGFRFNLLYQSIIAVLYFNSILIT